MIGREMYVEVNTLLDFAKGKKLFEAVPNITKNPRRNGVVEAMGILEGGTESGRTAVTFLLKDDQGEFVIADMTLSVLEAITTMARNADHNFRMKPQNQEAQ